MEYIGLTTQEINENRQRYGFNELPGKKRSLILLFLRQFQNILVYILAAALVLSILLPFLERKSPTVENFSDALVIVAILLLNAILGFVQEFRAEKALSALKVLSAANARVRRGGEELIIPARELVPGDIVILEAGDRIPADGELLKVSHFEVDESSLTGESKPVLKQLEIVDEKLPLAEQKNKVFSGTFVTKGDAEVKITATGVNTEIGKIAKMVAEVEVPPTPLQRKMAKLSKVLGLIVLVLCVILVGIGFLYGLTLEEMILLGASLAVSAVPESLPAVITICFAIGVSRMVKRNALVRRLDALETLGSVNVICSDKTGTITRNKMTVVETWLIPAEDSESAQKLLSLIGASNNRSALPNVGDPTELALLRYAQEHKVERLEIDEEEVPFTSEGKYMQTRHGTQIFLKGAPEKILELTGNLNSKEVLAANEEMAARGLRVLAAAVQEPSEDKPHLVGLFGMEDPPREGVKDSIRLAKEAGIRTIMITGDQVKTARAIAHQVGIEGEALEGKDLDALSTEELIDRVLNVSVFARVSPLHKLAILDALKRHGCIVAMTGDGVNDAPAIKGAHVGLAMGRDGTQVAREAASIVLADDDYSTIVRAVREGRRIYDNIRKSTVLLLRSNFDEIIFIPSTLLLGLPLPFHAIHLLWINLVTDSLPALALSMEPEEPDLMKQPPRPVKEQILTGYWRILIFATVSSFLVSLGYFFWKLSQGTPLPLVRTGVVTLEIVEELFIALSTRSKRPLFTIGFFGNPWLLGAIALALGIQIMALYTPLGTFLHFVPLSLEDWGIILLIATLEFILIEGFKYFSLKKTSMKIVTQ